MYMYYAMYMYMNPACYVYVYPNLTNPNLFHFVFDYVYNAVVEYCLFPFCWILWILTIRVH